MTNKKDQAITIRTTKTVKKAFQREAKRQDRSESAIGNLAILAYLNKAKK